MPARARMVIFASGGLGGALRARWGDGKLPLGAVGPAPRAALHGAVLNVHDGELIGMTCGYTTQVTMKEPTRASCGSPLGPPS